MKNPRRKLSELDKAQVREAKARDREAKARDREEAKFWRCASSELDRAAAKDSKARERELAKACGSKMQSRRNR